MKNTPQITIIISFCFALLFCYTATSKLLEFEEFQIQLAQSPLLSAYAGIISYAVIIIEGIVVLLLTLTTTRLLGLYSSLGLMTGFAFYIFLILHYSEFIPCSCGGILEKLGWTEHLVFNIAFIVLALIGIYFNEKQKDKYLLKPLTISSIIMVSACLVVAILFLSSEHIIKKENNFTRRFLQHPIFEDKRLDLKINSYYFAGATSGKIYLGNITAPLLLTSIDTTLDVIKTVRVHLDQSNYSFRNLQLQVRDSCFYLFDGSVPIIYRGIIGDSIARTVSYQDAYFTQLTVLDTGLFALRTQSSLSRQYMLASLNLQSNPKLKLFPSILEKQVDGVFDVDGKFTTSTVKNAEIIYTYTYRNQFIVLDRQLSVKKKLHTIDTTAIAKIQTRRLPDGTHTMNAPPLKVNGTATINRHLLFNQSLLMGKYESTKNWKQNFVVDLYRTDYQEYAGSFYLPKKQDDKLFHLSADDYHLYVLVENDLKRYRFREPISKYFKAGNAENLTQSRQ